MKGLPDVVPANVLSTGVLAEDNGWTVTPTHTVVPPRSIALRFRREAVRVWAIWQDGHFWRAYVNTAQRLGFGDLKAVLRDPSIITNLDPEDPFGTLEAEQ